MILYKRKVQMMIRLSKSVIISFQIAITRNTQNLQNIYSKYDPMEDPKSRNERDFIWSEAGVMSIEVLAP